MTDWYWIAKELSAAPRGRVVKTIAMLRGLKAGQLARGIGVTPGALSNYFAGRRQLEPAREVALFRVLDIPAPLLARSTGSSNGSETAVGLPKRGPWAETEKEVAVGIIEYDRSARLVCDWLSVALADWSSVGKLQSLSDWVLQQPIDGSPYLNAATVQGVRVEWSSRFPKRSPLVVSFNPRVLSPKGWCALRAVFAEPGTRHHITRVDVAVDYAFERSSVELLPLKTRVSKFSCSGTAASLGLELRSTRAGSPKSERHWRLYGHPHAAAPADKWTRLEAQHRLSRHRPSLLALGELGDPFADISICPLSTGRLKYPDTLILRDCAQFGHGYVRFRLGDQRYRDFCRRAPTLADASIIGPSELFAWGWRTVADRMVKALGLQGTRT